MGCLNPENGLQQNEQEWSGDFFQLSTTSTGTSHLLRACVTSSWFSTVHVDWLRLGLGYSCPLHWCEITSSQEIISLYMLCLDIWNSLSTVIKSPTPKTSPSLYMFCLDIWNSLSTVVKSPIPKTSPSLYTLCLYIWNSLHCHEIRLGWWGRKDKLHISKITIHHCVKWCAALSHVFS